MVSLFFRKKEIEKLRAENEALKFENDVLRERLKRADKLIAKAEYRAFIDMRHKII